MEIQENLSKILENHPVKIVFSNGKNTQYIKVTIEKKACGYYVEKRTEKQAFHENITEEELESYSLQLLKDGFKQLNAWDNDSEYSMKISKKGKVLFQKKKSGQPVKVSETHNRKKKYLLEEGTIIPPLVDMGIFTKEGKIVQSMYDKYKQINKFVMFIDEAIEKAKMTSINIIDFGCGKSYLTFVVYYYLRFVKQIEVTMTGLDLKAEVIAHCNEAAEKYGYDSLHFEVGDINGYQTDDAVDMVISLHACDTATDYALYNAICWNAKMIISVPCCQHELCAQLDSEELPIVQRYGIIKERTAALMTDAIRGNLLEYCGYKTQLLEFVDLTHTPKNILIRAIKSNIAEKHKAKMLEEVQQLTKCFSLDPTLYRLLKEAGKLND